MRKRKLRWLLLNLAGVLLVPILALFALASRRRKKPVDIGLGPQPLINNVYHKKALNRYGYTAETFVDTVFFITDEFDVHAAKLFATHPFLRHLRPRDVFKALYLFFRAIRTYRCVYLYFNGGPLALIGGGQGGVFARLEPLLYKWAGVKVVVMPYGSDISEMSRSPNLLLKHAMAQDYPSDRFRRKIVAEQIDRWTRHADHVIAGCDWVDYLYHWDTLMLAHFSIDTERWKPPPEEQTSGGPLKILHAPNHRALKGTNFFVQAVKDLVAEGHGIELTILEGVPNSEIRRAMEKADVVADQLVIGWYAMFALEAMAMGKPVLCYLRDDLEQLYVATGLVAPGEIPVIRCDPFTVKDVLRQLLTDRARLKELGGRSREFVLKHHSLEAVGRVFDRVNRSVGIAPR